MALCTPTTFKKRTRRRQYFNSQAILLQMVSRCIVASVRRLEEMCATYAHTFAPHTYLSSFASSYWRHMQMKAIVLLFFYGEESEESKGKKLAFHLFTKQIVCLNKVLMFYDKRGTAQTQDSSIPRLFSCICRVLWLIDQKISNGMKKYLRFTLILKKPYSPQQVPEQKK